MRFFHLSDLHIGKQLHHYSLLEEQRELLRQIVAYAKEEQPDAILIAGDIYDTPVPAADAVAVFDDFLTQLDDLNQELTVCVIAGNHDSPRRLDFASQILAKHAVYIAGLPPRTEEEYLKRVVLTDTYGEAVIYLLPFVKPAMVRKIFPNEVLSFSEAVTRLLEREEIDVTKRNILVSHQFYAGGGETPVTSDSEVHVAGGIDNVDIGVLEPFDYAALGHIHREQKVGDEQNRYCGTIFPYSVSEAEDAKFVTLVEMGAKGTEYVYKKLPLHPIRRVRKLTGTMEEVLAMARECTQDKEPGINSSAEPMEGSAMVKAEKCHDYVSITLTDEVEAYQPKEQLEEVYDHILEIRIDNSRTRKLMELGDFETENLEPYEAFCNFFAEINGREMTEEEDAVLKEVLQEGGLIEAE